MCRSLTKIYLFLKLGTDDHDCNQVLMHFFGKKCCNFRDEQSDNYYVRPKELKLQCKSYICKKIERKLLKHNPLTFLF